MVLARPLIQGVARREHGPILAGMALGRGDVADAAVAMLVVVPVHELPRPVSRRIQIGKALGRKLRPVFGGAEQRLGERIVVAHARPRMGRRDAEPVQHGEHGGAFQGGAIVAVQHRARRHGMYTLGQGGPFGQMRRMLGAVGLVHLEADDLAAEEIQDQVQVEPAALHLRRQEGHVPAPDLPWSGSHVGARRRRRSRRRAPARGGSSGRARAAPGESWPRWPGRRPHRPTPGRSVPAACRQSAAHWPRRRCAPVRPGSARAPEPGARPPVGDRPRANPSLARQRCSVRGVDAGQRAGRAPAVPRRARASSTTAARVWRSSRRVIRPRRRGRPPTVFLPAPARRPFRPAPCPCGAAPARVP